MQEILQKPSNEGRYVISRLLGACCQRSREKLGCDALFTFWSLHQSALHIWRETLNDIVMTGSLPIFNECVTKTFEIPKWRFR